MRRPQTLDELKQLIDRFDQPMLVYRAGRVLAVNAAYLELTGYAPEQIYDRPTVEFLPPEERARFAERFRMREAGVALGYARVLEMVTLGADGRRISIIAGNTVVPAADGGEPYAVSTCLELKDSLSEMARLLVEISASLTGARSEEAVRRLAVEGFCKAGLAAAFFEWRDGRLWPEDKPAEVSEARAADALEQAIPIFETTSPYELEPARVYVPIGSSLVLVLTGRGLSTLHAAAFNLFGRQVQAAIESARLITSLERVNEETGLLLDLARTTAATLELDRVLDVACDFLVKLLDVSNCFILLYDSGRQSLVGKAASAQHRAVFRSVVIPLASPVSLAARVAREKRPIFIEDVAAQGGADPELVKRFEEKALLALPLLSRDELVGVVVLDDTRGPRRFPPELIELAQATAGQLVLSIVNARLYESLKASYAELDLARAEMVKRERLAALGELAAIVAHEVRNPLGVIFNAVSSLRRLAPSKDAQMLVDIIREECDRLNRIVADLLDFARPGALAVEAEELAPVVQQAIENAVTPSERGLFRFDLFIEPDLPKVRMDRRMIRQALVNVLVNAVQAMPKGGRVQIRVGRDERNGQSCLRVDVTDEGPGIAPEVAARIFEPFFTTKAKGTGLGLAVVKRIVEDHHGEVEVKSEPGRGTTFTLRLSLDERAPAR